MSSTTQNAASRFARVWKASTESKAATLYPYCLSRRPTLLSIAGSSSTRITDFGSGKISALHEVQHFRDPDEPNVNFASLTGLHLKFLYCPKGQAGGLIAISG